MPQQWACEECLAGGFDSPIAATAHHGRGAIPDLAAEFMESARPRWALNAGRQVTFDGRPVFVVTRAMYGEDYGEDYDLTPPATLDRLTRDIVAALNAGGIEA